MELKHVMPFSYSSRNQIFMHIYRYIFILKKNLTKTFFSRVMMRKNGKKNFSTRGKKNIAFFDRYNFFFFFFYRINQLRFNKKKILWFSCYLGDLTSRPCGVLFSRGFYRSPLFSFPVWASTIKLPTLSRTRKLVFPPKTDNFFFFSYKKKKSSIS